MGQLKVRDYLDNIEIDRQEMIKVLKTKGISVNDNSTFTELIPKIDEIITVDGPTGTVYITENGEYDVKNKSIANVEVPTKTLGTKLITTNGTYNANDDNLDGYSSVVVNNATDDLSEYFNTTIVNKYDEIFKKLPAVTLLTGNGVFQEYPYEFLPNILNISQLENCDNMFAWAKKIKSITNLDLSSAKTASQMLRNCTELEEVEILNTNNIENFYSLFYNSGKLKSVSAIMADSVTNISVVFYLNSALTDFGGFINLGKGYSPTASANTNNYKLQLSGGSQGLSKLTYASLINIIDGLYDLTSINVKPQTLVLGSSFIARLTAEDIAKATAKGWNVS